MFLTSFILCSILSCPGQEPMASPMQGENNKPKIEAKAGNNLVGKVTVDGEPRQGVVVSDGINVVATDKNGEYQMFTDGRQHVFVSVPADCRVPLRHGAPNFYKTIEFSGDEVLQRDFELESAPVMKQWTLFTMADVQVGNKADKKDFVKMAPSIGDFVSTLSPNRYGVSLGDIVWNTPHNYMLYKAVFETIDVPVFSIIGNHDHNEITKGDTESDREFRDAMGPTYYSVNIGDCHLVALDDILYSGATGRNDYAGTITDAQLQWLAKDLSYVDKDKTVIICLHIPTSRRNVPYHITNNAELYDLLRGFNDVQILSGHTHINCTTNIEPNITETTFASVMGAFWYPLCSDGSPRGYGVLEFDGNKLVNKYYVGNGCDRDYQIKLYAPADAVLWDPDKKEGDPYDKILANIFFWHNDWTVEVQEDGGEWVTLTEADRLIPSIDGLRCWDPDVRKSMVEGLLPANHGGARPSNINDHMFLYTPKSTWQSVTVRATDPYGNVYSETINNN